jgi:predicted deacylase
MSFGPRTADQIARSIANWDADDDTYSPIRNNVERDLIVAALSPPQATNGLVQALDTALRQWKMYADMHEDRDEFDLASEKSPEADLYRSAMAALQAARALPLQDGSKK